jgi:tubulin polyglutamylase TTLL4
VLIDQSYKPWLLEVNVLPSLSSSSPFDKLVKSMLLCDTYHLIGFNVFDRRKVDEERKVDKNNRGIKKYINNQQ